jgi:hypothetical protein
MKSPICEMFDIEFPMVAFSHCRDVVVAVWEGAEASLPVVRKLVLLYADGAFDFN